MIEDKNQQRTPLSELGEFGLIDHLTKNFKMSFNIKNVLNNDVTRGYEDLDWLNHRAYIGRTYMLTGSYTMK